MSRRQRFIARSIASGRSRGQAIYAYRKLSGVHKGYSVAQARGHPAKGQTPISRTAPPKLTGAVGVHTKTAVSDWELNRAASRDSPGRRPGEKIPYTVYALKDDALPNWQDAVKRLLQSPEGRHQSYRLNAWLVANDTSDDDMEERYIRGIQGTVGTTFESPNLYHNIATIESYLNDDNRIRLLQVEFRK